MSNSYLRLGPEGRALANSNSGMFASQLENVPQELDYLIHELRNPVENTTVNKVVGYIYHYLPYVKVEHNLRLLMASFLNNPVCFGNNSNVTFEQNYLIIEAFKAITDKKLTISQPTLSIKVWYNIIYQELHNFVLFDITNNCWKAIPILSGIHLSNGLRDTLYSKVNVIEYNWFFKDWDRKVSDLYRKCLGFALHPVNNDNIINLTLLSLSTYFDREKNIKHYVPQISDSFMILRLIHLMFSNSSYSSQVYEKFYFMNPDDDNINQIIQDEISLKPVIKHLNRLSFLLESYLKQLSNNQRNSELIMSNIVKIQAFNKSLSQSTQSSIFNHPNSPNDQSIIHQQFWYFMKNIFFAECIVFQGILTRFIQSTRAPNFSFFINPFKVNYLPQLENDYRGISLKIIESFYYLNHILLSIGQGGFDSYNFVYYLSIELVLGSLKLSRDLEILTSFLIGNFNINLYHDVLNNDLISRDKVLYVLGLWENYLQLNNHNDEFVKNNIFNLCFDMVNDPKLQAHDVIEASHSVLLLCFSNQKANDNLLQSMKYVELIINQFPNIISSNQLSIAIETLGKQILSNPVISEKGSNSAIEFLEFMYLRCSNTPSGIPTKVNPSINTFTSAQPITEINAESTMRTLNSKDLNPNTVNIIDENKMKKPKNAVKLDILPDDLGPSPPKSEYNFQKRLNPETSREAILVAFMNLIPYLPLSAFVPWLERLYHLVDCSNASERQYLISVLWKVLSENLDLNRCEMAYRWWYETKEAVATFLGHEPVPGKL